MTTKEPRFGFTVIRDGAAEEPSGFDWGSYADAEGAGLKAAAGEVPVPAEEKPARKSTTRKSTTRKTSGKR